MTLRSHANTCASGARKLTASWKPCHITEDAKTTARVDDIVEGKTYEFQVRAHNKAGEGEPSQPTKPITCKSKLAKPFISGNTIGCLCVLICIVAIILKARPSDPSKYSVSYNWG